MNTASLTLPLLAATVVLAGCQPKSDELSVIAESVIVGPQFTPSKGLHVPDETRRSLGLKVVEIGEQKVPATFEFSLRIYEVAGGITRASAALSPERATAVASALSVQVGRPDGRPLAVKVTGVSGHTEQATGLVEVLAEIAGGSDAFAVGAFVAARALLAATETVVTVPRSALVQTTDGYSVYTVSGAHFVRTAVKLGAFNEEVAEIKDGLYAGDQVVSEPVMSLWLTELAAVKGGHACCVVPPKGK